MQTPTQHKTAIVLSGGGAYGAYEVGVVKALLAGHSPVTGYQPLQADIVAGSSAGAFNGAVLVSASDEPPERAAARLEATWLERLADFPDSCGNGAFRLRANLTRFIDPGCLTPNPLLPFVEAFEDFLYFGGDLFQRAALFVRSRESPTRRVLELINLHTFFTLQPFRKLLDKSIDPVRIRASQCRLLIATTNWGTGRLRVFQNIDMTDDRWRDIILASASVPGLPPVDIDGHPHADGSFTMNTPIVPAIKAGAETLHVIYLDPDPRDIPIETLDSSLGLMDKTYLITMASLFNHDIDFVNDINVGLRVLQDSSARHQPDTSDPSVVRSAARAGRARSLSRPLRELTVHRYRPSHDPCGVLGRMNFDRSRIEQLIHMGYEDAVHHDCTENNCVAADPGESGFHHQDLLELEV